VFWSEDGQTMYFDGQSLTVQGFCKFIHSINDAAQSFMCNILLFGDTETLAAINLLKLKDYVNVWSLDYQALVHFSAGELFFRRKRENAGVTEAFPYME